MNVDHEKEKGSQKMINKNIMLSLFVPNTWTLMFTLQIFDSLRNIIVASCEAMWCKGSNGTN